MKRISYILGLCALLSLGSCSYYARKSSYVNTYVQQGKINEAYKVLTSKPEKWEKRKDALLYYFMRGEVAWLLGKNEESIEYLKKADYRIEDERKKAGDYALSVMLNPKAAMYVGNEYEAVMLHYYQIMNYINTNQYDKAEVQARRLIIALQLLDDSRSDTKTLGEKKSLKFQRSAFGHVVLGFVYELRGNYNSAFISYRNALKIYDEDYKPFKVEAPKQLKMDILRMAYLSGFDNELSSYEREFGINFDPNKDAEAGNLILLWNNGMIPQKVEESINFTLIKDPSGWVTFVNSYYGYSFRVFAGPQVVKDSAGLAGVNFVRVAFPRLLDKNPYITGLTVNANNAGYNFEKLEDLQAVTHKIMDDNTLEEMGRVLLRLAVKKGSEYALKKENETAGTILNLVNIFSEQADTRSWNILPRDIFYTRITLPEGDQSVSLGLYAGNQKVGEETLKFKIGKGNTYIQAYQTPTSINNGRR